MTSGAPVKPLIPPAKHGGRKREVDPSGSNAGKMVKGKKRHVLVDTPGLLLHAVVHPATIQDRHGGPLVLSTLFGMDPLLLKLLVDGGYQGPQFHRAAAAIMRQLEVETVKRSDQTKGFEVLLKRWRVECAFA